MIVSIILLAGVGAVGLAIAAEIYGWHKGTRQATRQQKVYRVGAAVTLEGLLLMFLFGNQVAARHDPIFAICYWSIAFLLASVLVAAALLDVRESLAAYGAQRVEILRELLGREKRDK